MRTRLLACLMLLLTPLLALADHSTLRNDEFQTLPVNPSGQTTASFPTQLREWLDHEIPQWQGRAFNAYVYSGGIHATAGGLTSGSFATEAFVPERVNQTASAITYAAAANDICWVIISSDNNGITGWTRSGTTAYYYQCEGDTTPNQPALPPNSAWLMRVNITGSAIAAVVPLTTWHPTLPGRAVFADRMAGADLGAKINAADAQLGAGPGEILVTRRAGVESSTAIVINSAHQLVFLDPTVYTFTAGITLKMGAGIRGVPIGGSVTDATTTEGMWHVQLNHNFNGDFITFDGLGTPQGGGYVRDLFLWQIFNGDLAGNAIKLLANTDTNRPTWVFLERVFIDGTATNKRWTRAVYAEGTAVTTVGSPGLRDLYIRDSSFSSAGTSNQTILLSGCFVCWIDSVSIRTGNHGAANPGVTITGDATVPSSNILITHLDTSGLVLDYAKNIGILGGAASTVTADAHMASFGSNHSQILGMRMETDPVNAAGASLLIWYADWVNGAWRPNQHGVLLNNNRALQAFTSSGSTVANLMRMDGSNRVLIDQNGWGVTIGSGTETKISGTLAWTRGNTVASGSSITLPVGNSAVITGTTNVDTIVATGTDGRHICVEFDNALTMKNATGNLFLGADFGPTNANSTLCLLSDGTKWRKTGGSIN